MGPAAPPSAGPEEEAALFSVAGIRKQTTGCSKHPGPKDEKAGERAPRSGGMLPPTDSKVRGSGRTALGGCRGGRKGADATGISPAEGLRELPRLGILKKRSALPTLGAGPYAPPSRLPFCPSGRWPERRALLGYRCPSPYQMSHDVRKGRSNEDKVDGTGNYAPKR